MKLTAHFLFALLVFAAPLAAQDQALRPDERLLTVFDAAHLEMLRTESPLQLLRYNYYLDHSWFLVKVPAEKAKGAEGFPVVHIADAQQLNILAAQRDLNLQRAFDRPTYYRLEGTDQVLVLRSEKEFARMFDAERRKRGF